MMTDSSSIVNWSVVGASLVAIISLTIKIIIPVLEKFSVSGKKEEADDFRELREALQKLVEGQTTILEMLRQRTNYFERQETILADMLKIIREMEQRSRGQDTAIGKMDVLVESTTALTDACRIMAESFNYQTHKR